MTENVVVADNSDVTWPIAGHAQIIRELRAAVRRGPNHAYIFAGMPHLGKRSTAVAFAQALMCEQPLAPGVPCGDCRNCRRIARGTHPDVNEWNLERQMQTAEKSTTSRNLTINIQTVRDVSSSLAMRPFESRYRVAIVDDVQTMQETAQEAFLKTLEEPPAYAVIILLTTDADILLETIRSRAATVQFQPVPAAIIASNLIDRGIDAGPASELADSADGRPGWAILTSIDSQLATVQEQVQADALRWIQADRYNQIIEATKLGEIFFKERETVYARLAALQRQWRREFAAAIDAGETSRTIAILQALKSIDTCFSDLDANVRPRLALQNMVLQWPNPQT